MVESLRRVATCGVALAALGVSEARGGEMTTGTVVQLLGEGDSYQAIEYLHSQGTALRVMSAYDEAARHAYWKEKDLGAVVVLARAGIQFGLESGQALEGVDAAMAAEVKGKAKALAYNLASFAWPGWDEPDIEISARDVELGLDAARVNLRLAGQLGRGTEPIFWRPDMRKGARLWPGPLLLLVFVAGARA